jgi:hypothetical protein
MDGQYYQQNIAEASNKILDKRNPPPLTVSCAPSGDEGPTVYIQTKEEDKNNLFRVQIKIPVGCQNILPYTKNPKTHSDWCSRADIATENRWTVNIPSFN